jgi:ribosome-associated protein
MMFSLVALDFLPTTADLWTTKASATTKSSPSETMSATNSSRGISSGYRCHRRMVVLLQACLFAILAFQLSFVSSFSLARHNQPRSTVSIAGYQPSLLLRSPALSLSSLSSSLSELPILCDLQTFLRLVNAVSTGGAAKTIIQGGQCFVNGVVETRRAKKLYAGDVVTLMGGSAVEWNVAEHVQRTAYIYEVKAKKEKPLPQILPDGSLEFGGRFRSESWRMERKQRKDERRGGSFSSTSSSSTSSGAKSSAKSSASGASTTRTGTGGGSYAAARSTSTSSSPGKRSDATKSRAVGTVNEKPPPRRVSTTTASSNTPKPPKRQTTLPRSPRKD